MKLVNNRSLCARIIRCFVVTSTSISTVFSFPQRRHRACSRNRWWPGTTLFARRVSTYRKLGQTHIREHILRVSRTYSRKSARIHVTPPPRLRRRNLPEITGCSNGWPMYAYLYVRIYARCICRARATGYVRGYLRVHIRVSRFSIATCSPSCPLYPARRVQFPCPTNNPIYTPDYSGNRRGTERVAANPLFSSSTWLLPLSDPLEPHLLRACADYWLNRHGWFEGACPQRRFDRAGSARTWLIVTFLPSSLSFDYAMLQFLVIFRLSHLLQS